MGRFWFVEEVALADCAMDVEGRDLEDLFATAAAALAEVMVDPSTVALTVERAIELDASALDLLLYDWLSELIFLKDRDREVFPRCQIRVGGDGPFHLKGKVQGGAVDPERTGLRADPKAVTFHQFALEPVANGWRARVVIDI